MTRTMGFVTAVAALVAPAAAQASVYSDDLGKCLVEHTSGRDKAELIQWVFAVLAVHPAVQKMSTVTPAQRDALDRSTAAMFDRLLLTDCRSASVAALKYDGVEAFKASFSLLGQVAMKSLTDTPDVDASFGKFTVYLDETKLKALFAEAGVAMKGKPAK